MTVWFLLTNTIKKMICNIEESSHIVNSTYCEVTKRMKDPTRIKTPMAIHVEVVSGAT